MNGPGDALFAGQDRPPQDHVRRVSCEALRARLLTREELALLDVREQGVHALGHPFFACSLPLSRIELKVLDLLPRRSVPLVLLDGGDGDTHALRAAQRLEELGYFAIEILEGGCAEWARSGGELFSGVNVPSKAFGEFVEHHYDTPRLPPQELARLMDEGRDLVIVDSRPFAEYQRMNIPGAVDVPGAELVWRIHDLAPDPSTLVVVNCAGRTRSIIGCQSLRNAGLPNPVLALKDGTMGWELSGRRCERGSVAKAAPPSPEAALRARARADAIARRHEVQFVSRQTVQAWRAAGTRTVYLLDVRSPEEFEARRIAGSVHAPGGQLVQATDETIAVRNARVILIDPERVRAVMTASWLNQMGLRDVHVLEPEGADGFEGWRTESGLRLVPVAGFAIWPLITVEQLKSRLQANPPGGTGLAILDLSTSLAFRRRHIAGAWWGVRARLEDARAALPDIRTLILTSGEGLLAHLSAPVAMALWPGVEVRVLDGGNGAWRAAGLPFETGLHRCTTRNDDVWYRPYDHETDQDRHAQAYLDWEVALVDQIRRDPAIRFRLYD